jgi:hypothetical protein
VGSFTIRGGLIEGPPLLFLLPRRDGHAGVARKTTMHYHPMNLLEGWKDSTMDCVICEDQSEDHSMTRTRINWYFLRSLLAFGASAAV